MNKFHLMETTIAQVHAAMLAGELTCRGLTEAYLSRIDAYEKKGPAINAIILINPDALEQADRLDAALKETGRLTGPLHGIPVMLKDNVDTQDMPTTAGSASLEGFVPDDDAFITTRLRSAGALILAKTNLHEFAIWGRPSAPFWGRPSTLTIPPAPQAVLPAVREPPSPAISVLLESVQTPSIPSAAQLLPTAWWASALLSVL